MSATTPVTLTGAPVAQSERIQIIDALRGFAILGILLMNIPGFGLPSGGNPELTQEYGTINFRIWQFVNWFPEGTQRAIFSLLFGAGILLFTSRQEKKIDTGHALEYFTRRQLWLIFFGIIDVYLLLWFGDILFDYGCYGLIMVAFRKWSPKWLLIAAGVCFLFMVAHENRDLYQEKKIIRRGEAIAALDTTVTKLTPQQKEQLAGMESRKEESSLESQRRNRERGIRNTTGSYEELYNHRTGIYQRFALVHYTYLEVWDVIMFMFLGMALFKLGILTGEAKAGIYWIMTLVGLGLGLLVSYWHLRAIEVNGYNDFNYHRNVSFEAYTLSRTLRGLGIYGLLMLLYKSGWFKWLFAIFRPVGQMAFTNYLTQSLICGFIFYGIGLGWYGQLQRYEAYLVVLGVWALQIVWSHIWLRYFYFGPFEWAWRSLTYWKKQPLRR